MPRILNKKNISLFIIVFINFLFLLKYSKRASQYYILISSVIIFFQLFLIQYFEKVFSFLKKIKISPLLILITISIISLIVANKIPLENLKIDRWSVTSSFWDNYFKDLYVYNAKSFDGNNPGPMPFYFIIMLPFYFLKEYSYITVIAIFLLYSKIRKSKERELFTILVISSVYIYYEIIARSNIFFNSTLILISLFYFFNKNKSIVLNGIIFGLLLSTRNVFVIVYGITFLFSLKKDIQSFKYLFTIGLISVLTFALTFLPFIYNHYNDFLKINPFIIQSSALLPFNYSITCIIASLFLVYFIKNNLDVFFYSGIALFLTISIYFLYWIFNIDLETAFFNSYADITYFIFCVPFFMYYYVKTKNPVSF